MDRKSGNEGIVGGYKNKVRKKHKYEIAGEQTPSCILRNTFFILHGTLVSHAGEGAVNLFDHRTGIKSTFYRAKYAFLLHTLTASCYTYVKSILFWRHW